MAQDIDTTDLEKAHEILGRIWDESIDLKPLLKGASSDVLFALGQALGSIGTARALIGRDIDKARRQ
jgi:hypothetical protein